MKCYGVDFFGNFFSSVSVLTGFYNVVMSLWYVFGLYFRFRSGGRQLQTIPILGQEKSSMDLSGFKLEVVYLRKNKLNHKY